MPYIERVRRGKVLTVIPPESAGELNYAFTTLIKDYIKRKDESYQVYNDIIGALEGAKLELYRRHTAPYEDKKIIANGDL